MYALPPSGTSAPSGGCAPDSALRRAECRGRAHDRFAAPGGAGAVHPRPRHGHTRGRRRRRRRRAAKWNQSPLLGSEALGGGLPAAAALTAALSSGCTDGPPATQGRAPIAGSTGMRQPSASSAPSDSPSTPPTEPAPVSSRPSRQPTSASTSPSQPRSTHCHNSPSRCTHSIARGDTGPDVKRLQQFLHGQGFTYVSATGLFDDATLRGVVQYPHGRSITGDPRGVFGPATRASSETAQRSTAHAG